MCSEESIREQSEDELFVECWDWRGSPCCCRDAVIKQAEVAIGDLDTQLRKVHDYPASAAIIVPQSAEEE